ncbi:MAG: TPM domain-containing protein [Bacteroidales bacterium]|nr:TPM domain-containing protein [Bacteroidales bacterium]
MNQNARKFFNKEEKESIKKAILNAELDTSGEIRVHIESKCDKDVLDRAAFLFDKLGMHKTELRNGVLVYLAVNSQKFAIIGDKGINAVVPKDFWADIKEKMAERFNKGEFTEGLAEGITETGKHLKKHFPRHIDDINELPDEISFGD